MITRTTLIITLSLSLFSSVSYAQKFEIGLQAGYGSFDMSELNTLQNAVINEAQFSGLKNTELFPSFFNFGAFANYMINDKSMVKIHVRYESTGARAAYSDYSGSFTYDQLVDQTIVSLGYRFISTSEEITTKFLPFLEFSVGTGFANLTLEQNLVIDDISEQFNANFEEQTVFIEPGIGFRIDLGSLAIEPYLNYLLNIYQTGLALPNNSDAKLMYESDEVNTQWSGYRTGINLIVKF
ncbi:MAG: hypothetical protein ACPGGA_09240 [Balneolaceae bacterium]